MKNKIKGLLAAPFTPMDDHGALNLDQIPKLVQLYEKNGVNGVFIGGSSGEGVSLTHREKQQLIEAWGKSKGQLQTIFMLGGTCLKEIQELAVLAKKNQIDGISIFSPNYFKPVSVDMLVTFCKEVAGTTPELPFYYYHIPALTNGHYSMYEFLEKAHKQIPNLAGIKFSHLDLLDFQNCTLVENGKYDMLWGTDEALLSGWVAGARGAIGSTYNYAAPLYNGIIQAFDNGDMEEARRLQLLAVKMVQLLVKYGGTRAGKAFMKIIGLDCGWFRLPLEALNEKELESLTKELEAIGFFEFCSKI